MLRSVVAVAAAGLIGAAPVRAQAPDTAAVGRIHAAVLEASPELAAARAGVAVARGRLAAAGFGTPVVLSAEAEDVPGGLNLPQSSFRLHAEKVFLPAGQAAAERQVAMADVEAASARVTALRHLLVARANRALLHAVGYAAVARRLADEDALLSSAAASIQTEFAVGKSTYVDVLRLRTERLRVQTERSTALARAQAGRATFEALVPPGSPGRAEALSLLDTLVAHGAVRSLLALLPPAPDVDSLLQVSGALQIANAAVRRAEAQRSLMLAQQHPQFSASLGVQRFTGDQGGATLGPVFGGSISLPFTARNANRTALAAADLELAAATAERTAARATLRADLMAARELYENALEHLAIYDTALLQAAAQEREGALASFRAGQLTLTVLLDFERGLSAAMTDRLQSEVDAADALDQLLTATWTAGAPATSSSRP